MAIETLDTPAPPSAAIPAATSSTPGTTTASPSTPTNAAATAPAKDAKDDSKSKSDTKTANKSSDGKSADKPAPPPVINLLTMYTELRYLNISNNRIKKLKNVSALKNLCTVNAQHNNV